MRGNKSSSEDTPHMRLHYNRYVEETALVLEQALIQQQQLHGMAKGDGITKSEVCRVKKGEEGNRTQKKLQKGELFQVWASKTW